MGRFFRLRAVAELSPSFALLTRKLCNDENRFNRWCCIQNAKGILVTRLANRWMTTLRRCFSIDFALKQKDLRGRCLWLILQSVLVFGAISAREVLT